MVYLHVFSHLSVVIVACLEHVCGYEKETWPCFDRMETRHMPTIHGRGVLPVIGQFCC